MSIKDKLRVIDDQITILHIKEKEYVQIIKTAQHDLANIRHELTKFKGSKETLEDLLDI